MSSRLSDTTQANIFNFHSKLFEKNKEILNLKSSLDELRSEFSGQNFEKASEGDEIVRFLGQKNSSKKQIINLASN